MHFERQEKNPHIVVGINHHIQEMRVLSSVSAAFLDNPNSMLCLPQLTWGKGKHSPDLEREERSEML